ncbi:MAG TPA: sigma-70 family RNA polymerase sigma factor [Polyangiaceae bacterium]|nr:sigma-70 family RNA polymerase sigma factor [Polyangiaceae bacterium]
MKSVAPLQSVSPFPTDRLGDAELVQAVLQGNSEAAGLVWDRYSPLVRSVLRGNLGLDADVEDLLQEVFMVFLRSASELRSQSALRSFLVAVAVRLVLVELRRRRVRRWITLSPDGELPEAAARPEDVEGAAALRGLYRLLERMPHRPRVAFVLRHVEGLELNEVARALNVSASTVKREIGRARKAIFTRAKRSEPALWQFLSRFEEDADA